MSAINTADTRTLHPKPTYGVKEYAILAMVAVSAVLLVKSLINPQK